MSRRSKYDFFRYHVQTDSHVLSAASATSKQIQDASAHRLAPDHTETIYEEFKTRFGMKADSGPKISFMSLTPELRRRICRIALVRKSIVLTVNKNNCRTPALLKTTTEIRKEAESIYFHENSFQVVIKDMKFEPHREHWVWKTEPCFAFRGSFSYRNFVDQWLSVYWEEEFYGHRLSGLPLSWICIDMATTVHTPGFKEGLKIVERMAADGVRWHKVKQVLDSWWDEEHDYHFF